MGISTIVTADFTRFLSSPAAHATMVFLQQPHSSHLNSLAAAAAAASDSNHDASASHSPPPPMSLRFANSFNRRMRAADGARSRPQDNVGSRYHVQPLQLLDPCRSASALGVSNAGAASAAGGGTDAPRQTLIRGWVATDDAVVLLCEVQYETLSHLSISDACASL